MSSAAAAAALSRQSRRVASKTVLPGHFLLLYPDALPSQLPLFKPLLFSGNMQR